MSVALISTTLISTLLPQILNTFLMFLTPKKEEYYVRVEIHQQQLNCEELEVARFVRLTFKLRTTNKVSILDDTINFVPVVSTGFVSL